MIPLTDLPALGLDPLVQMDELRGMSIGAHQVLIHKDHRWLLPLIHVAQQLGDLPTPANLVMFDHHHDAFEPQCLNEIVALRAQGVTTAALVDLCANHLSTVDNDWLQAGMQLGLIKDAVLFGVDEWDRENFPMVLTDVAGQAHRIEIMWLPGSELSYQGSLSDLAKSYALEQAWDILGWQHHAEIGFRFAEEPKIVLDFDLDCFKLDWTDYTFPFPQEVFEREFLTPSRYHSVNGVTGRDFVLGLAAKAGLVTIATEPNHCGGQEKAQHILECVSKYVLTSPADGGAPDTT